MKRHYPIIIEQDRNGVFIVQCQILKGCRSYGATIDEAITNIKEAIEACIEDDDFMDQSTFIGVRDIELAFG